MSDSHRVIDLQGRFQLSRSEESERSCGARVMTTARIRHAVRPYSTFAVKLSFETFRIQGTTWPVLQHVLSHSLLLHIKWILLA